MYSTELRRPGWDSMPPLLKVVLLGGIMVGVGGLVAAGVASADARDAEQQAQAAVERIEQEGLERDFLICAAGNDLRGRLVGVFNALAAQQGPLTAEQQASLDLLNDGLAPQECPPDPSP